MSETTGFAPLDDSLEDLAGRLEPRARKQLTGRIATDLRSTNAKRIRSNETPTGEPMVPRKAKLSKAHAAKKGRMFRAAAKPAYLRKESTDAMAIVGFSGAMSRIMRVHQDGLRDTVSHDAGSPRVAYPARPVLGLSPDDRLRILDQVTAQIEG